MNEMPPNTVFCARVVPLKTVAVEASEDSPELTAAIASMRAMERHSRELDRAERGVMMDATSIDEDAFLTAGDACERALAAWLVHVTEDGDAAVEDLFSALYSRAADHQHRVESGGEGIFGFVGL